MSTNNFSVSNEQLLLIEILNSMYNDNLRQINNLTTYISNLNESNTQIRNFLIQILQNPNRRNTERRNGRTNTTHNNNNLGRIYLNNTPYIIDNVQQYRINTNRNYNRNYANELSNTNFSRILQSFFQPVEVFPTQSQIEAATRRVRYSDIITPRNRSCPISLDNFEDNEMVTVIRQCGHIFRSDDLNTWFMSHCNCPVCRYDIRDYNSNASSEFFSDNGTETTNVNASSNQLPREQNNSSEPSIERNVSENLNERARNLRDDNTNVLNLFLDNISGNQSDIINNFTDASGNIFNNIFNDTLSDPTVILSLLTALNNRSHR